MTRKLGMSAKEYLEKGIDKICKDCEKSKHISLFYLYSSGSPFSRCKECHNKLTKKANQKPERKEYSYWYNVYVRYGLSKEEYNIIYNKQNGCCAICRKHQKDLSSKLFVDHCHTTGIVRGLLCSACNSMLGYAEDNIETLHKAIQYLDEIK